MRTLCTAACLALCSTGALAADYGIGVSAKSNDGWIYLPIDVSQSFRIEPSVRYSSNDISQVRSSDGDTFEQDSDNIEIGVGLFRRAKVAESARFYYGLRASYVKVESATVYTTTFFPGFTEVVRDETSQDGYRIGPAIGFEYLFGEHFSIGGEANYTFVDVEGDVTSTRSDSATVNRGNIEQKSSGTDTQLIIRYRF